MTFRVPLSVTAGWRLTLCAVLALSSSVALGATLGWVEVRPIRQYNRVSPSYADIMQRIAPNGIAGSIEGDTEGPVHDAHETTHRLNSLLRNQAGGEGFNAAYLVGGRACVFREPRVSLAAVAQHVPPAFRLMSFGTYLQQSQGSWNDHPLYVLDEWSAYLNGTRVALELRGTVRGETRTAAAALEFIAYGTALLQAVERLDPQYAQRADLEQFIGTAVALSRQLAEQAQHVPGVGSGELVAVRRAVETAYIQEEN